MISTTTARLSAALLSSCLLAACGGGGSSGAGGDGDGSSPDPTKPDGFPATVRTDFVLPYQTPTLGITTVQAGSFTGAALRTTVTPEFSWKEDAGGWDNGVLRQARPNQLIYLDADRWMRLSLRDSTSSPIDTGVRESSAVCSIFTLRTDYANPARGIMTYSTAGEDQACFGSDDQVKAFRLDKTDAPTTLAGTRAPRIFRNPATGALTGVLVQDGNTLRLYAADLSSSRVIAEGIVGTASTGFGFSSSAIWGAWSNGTTRAIYRIDAAGTVTPVFEANRNDTLTNGLGNFSGALYFTHRPGGVPDNAIVRLPLAGGDATIVHEATNIGQVLAAAAGGLIYASLSSSDGKREVRLVRFGTAGSEVLGRYSEGDGLPFLPAVSTTSDGRFMFSLHEVSEGGSVVVTAHLVSPQNPAQTKVWQQSEWLGAVSEDFNFNNPDNEPVTHGVLVKAFTGSYRTEGHGGGTLALYSFATNREYPGTVLPQGVRLGSVGSSVSSPIGLTTLSTLGPDGTTQNADIYGFNLRDFTATQVTNTPADNERLLPPP